MPSLFQPTCRIVGLETLHILCIIQPQNLIALTATLVPKPKHLLSLYSCSLHAHYFNNQLALLRPHQKLPTVHFPPDSASSNSPCRPCAVVQHSDSAPLYSLSNTPVELPHQSPRFNAHPEQNYLEMIMPNKHIYPVLYVVSRIHLELELPH